MSLKPFESAQLPCLCELLTLMTFEAEIYKHFVYA